MKALRVLDDELAAVLADGKSAQGSLSAKVEQKAMQNLYAKALRRALRRIRSGGERRVFQ
jgi:hypothetical protein